MLGGSAYFLSPAEFIHLFWETLAKLPPKSCPLPFSVSGLLMLGWLPSRLQGELHDFSEQTCYLGQEEVQGWVWDLILANEMLWGPLGTNKFVFLFYWPWSYEDIKFGTAVPCVTPRGGVPDTGVHAVVEGDNPGPGAVIQAPTTSYASSQFSYRHFHYVI